MTTPTDPPAPSATEHEVNALALRRAIELHQQGALQQAAALYLDILAIEPDHFDALHLLGVYALQADDAAAGFDLIARAIEIDPRQALAHVNLGVTLQKLGRRDDAITSYQRALALEPEHLTALNNCANTLLDMQRYDDAIAYFERALRIDPAYPEALNNLGYTLIETGRHTEALVCLARALEVNPDYVAAHFNRANALQYLNQLEAAQQSYGAVLQREPTHVDANFNEGVCRLLAGDYQAGLPKYEWRWRKEGYRQLLQGFTQPLWQGLEALHGRTILLHSEQGSGDTIQFCRYAPALAALGAKVLLRVQPALVSLLSGLDGVHRVIGDNEPLPAYDMHCPIMSLPARFLSRPDTLPAPARLTPDPARVRAWGKRLGEHGGGAGAGRIGVCWSGNPEHDNDTRRSIRLIQFQRLLAGPGHFVSLQKDVRAVDRLLLERDADTGFARLARFEAELTDFAETAALIANLDLIVTVDTAVAHLAASMEKPVWLLLPFAPDWRWMRERADSVWYATMRLWRQPSPGDWDSVLNAVAERLERGWNVD
ncbi:MAG: tetratricopeptide repeat protein [Pseudomonadota bacterium]